MELATREITVNCVAPGLIETDMTQGAPLEAMLKEIPLSRVGTAGRSRGRGELPDSAPTPAYITRQVIRVDGGHRVSKRVVVTGMGGISPLGNDWDTVRAQARELPQRRRRMEEWDEYEGLNARLGAPAAAFDLPAHYTRKTTRSMGRVALMATLASERALADAGLLGDPVMKSGRMGIAYGSSSGTPIGARRLRAHALVQERDGITATTYLQMMSNTAAVNISVFFGITGRIDPHVERVHVGQPGHRLRLRDDQGRAAGR